MPFKFEHMPADEQLVEGEEEDDVEADDGLDERPLDGGDGAAHPQQARRGAPAARAARPQLEVRQPLVHRRDLDDDSIAFG